MEEALDWGIPALLIIVTLGFIYTKFFEPYVTSLLKKLWEWFKAQNNPEASQKGKEIVYGD